MRKLNLLAAIAVISLAGGTAVAQENPAKPAKEKKICKGEAHSETRIARQRVCKTEAQWARESSPEGRNAAKSRGMDRGN